MLNVRDWFPVVPNVETRQLLNIQEDKQVMGLKNKGKTAVWMYMKQKEKKEKEMFVRIFSACLVETLETDCNVLTQQNKSNTD